MTIESESPPRQVIAHFPIQPAALLFPRESIAESKKIMVFMRRVYRIGDKMRALLDNYIA
jgi:hypothetical protein